MSTTSENPTLNQPLGLGSQPSGASSPSQPPGGQYQPPPGQYQQGPYQPQQGQYQQQQGQYQPPPGQYQQGQYQAPPPRPQGQNVLGIVALAVTVLGFILTVIPATHFFGLFVLPVGFLLSVVALFLKDKSKKWALVALALSIVGAIVGGVIFAMTVVGAVDEAIKSETTFSEPAVVPADEVPADEVQADEVPAEEIAEDPVEAEEPSGDLGTRSNPLAMGSTLSGEEWQVTVNSFTPDATAEIMAVNQYNEEPEAGYTYALVNVTVERLVEDSGYPSSIEVNYVTAAGNVINSYDVSIVVAEDLSFASELYKGAEATGNVGLMIPADDAGTLRITPGFFEDEVFFAIS